MVKIVKAKKVRVGDFIPGLDNGYVVENEAIGFEGEDREIWFHDARGGENRLIVGKNMPITVSRG